MVYREREFARELEAEWGPRKSSWECVVGAWQGPPLVTPAADDRPKRQPRYDAQGGSVATTGPLLTPPTHPHPPAAWR